jgi:hypothetical protein
MAVHARINNVRSEADRQRTVVVIAGSDEIPKLHRFFSIAKRAT